MSKRDPLVRLRHMLDYSKEAVEMARGKTAAEISGNRQLGLALTHLVELIGEAASQVLRDVQDRYPPNTMVQGRQHAEQAYSRV